MQSYSEQESESAYLRQVQRQVVRCINTQCNAIQILDKLNQFIDNRAN